MSTPETPVRPPPARRGLGRWLVRGGDAVVRGFDEAYRELLAELDRVIGATWRRVHRQLEVANHTEGHAST